MKPLKNWVFSFPREGKGRSYYETAFSKVQTCLDFSI